MVMRGSASRRTVTLLGFGVMFSSPAFATWSIVATDRQSKEVGVASVTCLTSLDLRAITPVVLVEVGAAAVQASGDFDGIRRPVIHDELLAGTTPADLLTILSGIPGHQSRQYGIADTFGLMTSFTGTANGAWASEGGPQAAP